MKELTIEQKAQRYDKALEKAKGVIEQNPLMEYLKKGIEYIFPELKESEDERVKNYIISCLNNQLFTDGSQADIERKKAIAWLEKQGEHANFRNKIQVGDKVTRNEDGVLVNLSQLNRVAKKQGEQKPADKVEPKFHEGEWVTNGDYTWKIVEIKPLDYILQSQDGNIVDDTISHVDEQFHSFTIKDAKDGDVLAYKDEISLYKHDIKNCTKQETTFGGFVYHCCYDGKRFITNSLYSLTEQDKTDIHPAIKEQSDTLMKAMADAGYTFDFEKRELKKLSHSEVTKISDQDKDFEWSEEDEEYLNFVIATMKTLQVKCTENEIKRHSNSQAAPYYTKVINWLKFLKDKYIWKPSYEQIVALECAVNDVQRFSSKSLTLQVENEPYWRNLVSLLKQLKKLRED